MIKAKLGHRLDAWLRRLLPFLFRRPVNPNLLTATGTGISLLAGAAFAQGRFVAGGLLMLAGGAFDLLDGMVAREHGLSSRFGAFLDSTLDRVADMAVLLGIAMHYAQSGQPGGVLLAGYALCASVLVSYAQARVELVVPSFRVGLWVVAIGSSATVVQRMLGAHRAMRRLDAGEAGEVGENI
jgi:phosphatidylglycerophosphate synthase